MFRTARAAAYAVAAFTVAFTATYSPSLAWQLEPAPREAQYLDHAAAVPEQLVSGETPEASPVPNEILAPTSDISEHVVAPIVVQSEEMPVRRRSLHELVGEHASARVTDSEHECLAGAVYFESKGEPLLGQLAVARVILNRAASGRFPTSICGVVKQKSQFSFVRGGRIPFISKSSEAWRKAVAIAHIAKKDLAEGGVGKAMFFHARYVSPRWRLTKVASIGNHIFYR